MSQVQAQTKGLTLLWRFAQPPLRYRRPKRILAIRERTPPSVWFGHRVQLPGEVSWGERITPRGFAGKPQMSDEPSCLFVVNELRRASNEGTLRAFRAGYNYSCSFVSIRG